MTELERKISRLKQLPINRARTNKILAEVLTILLAGESEAVTQAQLEAAITAAINEVLPLDGSREMTGDLHMGEQKVIDMGDPVNPRDGVNLQALNNSLSTKQSLSEKGQNNGYAPLDSSGVVPLEHLNVSGLSFLGAWDASTNTPTLSNSTGTTGQFYKVSTEGTQDFGSGSYTFIVGDWVMHAAGEWQRIGVHEAVSSVNGKTGSVVITPSDINLGNVDNTSDVDKPVSTAQQTALDGKVDKAGGTMTGSLSMSNNKITNIANGTNPTDAVNLQQLENIKSLDSLRGNISPAIPAVYSIISTPQSLPDSSNTLIEWTNVIYDPFSLVSGTDITIPVWATHARITLGLLFENNNVGYRYGGVQLNGSSVYGDRSNAIDGSWTNLVFSTAIFPVSSGDIIRASAWQNSGGSLNISNADDIGTWIQVELYENIS